MVKAQLAMRELYLEAMKEYDDDPSSFDGKPYITGKSMGYRSTNVCYGEIVKQIIE